MSPSSGASLDCYEGMFFPFYNELRAAQMDGWSLGLVGLVSIEGFLLQTFSRLSHKSCFK